jgi:hypothetical protein
MTSKVLWNVLGAPIALVAMVGSAMAGDLFSGPVFSANQVFATCEITNVTNAPVTISGKSIFNKLGVNLALTANTCGPTLAPFNSCAYWIQGVANNTVHVCFARIVEPNTRVRATAYARNISNITYSESQMR